MRHRTFATLVLLQLVFGRSSAQVSRRAQSLLGQMTLEEKIGQLNLAAGVGLGGFGTAASDTDIIHGRVGAILWLADPKEMNRLQHLAVEQSRMHLTQSPESDPRFTSRYWDISSKPLYPFGYGLSYTIFQFTNLRLSKTRMKVGDSVEVVVDVTNTGSVAGDVVAQLYIHQRAGSASRPVRQLEGFRRVTLQPGETSTLRFSLRRDELKFWSPRTKRWVVEPSIFDVWAGEDSRADLHAELTIEP